MKSQGGGDSEMGPVIPLLMQNKPPIDETTDVLADVAMRPESVSSQVLTPVHHHDKLQHAVENLSLARASGSLRGYIHVPIAQFLAPPL